ncbi:MAG: calcium/sodium antiporter [Rubripirellula sp.]
MLVVGQILLGLVLLVVGGELLVRGASALASAFRISPLVIGLTVVAFGTSAPELGVSLQAALTGNADVAVGNVVGSNIVNILVVLGASAIITPLIVSRQLIRLDLPLMIVAAVAMWVSAMDGVISRAEGGMMFVSLVTYLVYSIRASRRESIELPKESSDSTPSATGWKYLALQVVYFVAGLALLSFGARFLVEGAVTIASRLGISQLVIGLTVVAIGTSLPEVVTSLVASYRGQRDIAVGNVVGSNLFNVCCVVGLTGIIAPDGIPVGQQAINVDLPIMVAVTMVCFPVFWTGGVIKRFEGVLFLTYFGLYTAFLVVSSTNPESGSSFGKNMLMLVTPLTVIALAFSFWDGRRQTVKKEELTETNG